MENIWTKINDDIPLYMKKICEKYGLVCVKISPLKTAVVGKTFALIIGIDRFYASVSYLYVDGKEMRVYACNNYFAEKYDADDRVNLLDESGADSIVRNNIIVITNGLLSKWGDVLEGKTDWIERYKRSNLFYEEKLPQKEMREIEKYF